MARMRIIKPSFFTNEALSEMSPLTRLYFIGLWCLCDREGKMEYRPKRIKVELFPYEDVNMEEMTSCLHDAGMVNRYEINGQAYIKITKFTKHQHPHVKETSKGFPEPDGSTMQAPCSPDASPLENGNWELGTGNMEGQKNESTYAGNKTPGYSKQASVARSVLAKTISQPRRASDTAILFGGIEDGNTKGDSGTMAVLETSKG